MSDEKDPLPVSLAIRLRESVDFSVLAEWAKNAERLQKDHLAGDLDERETQRVRGEIDAMKRVVRLGQSVQRVLDSQKTG